MRHAARAGSPAPTRPTSVATAAANVAPRAGAAARASCPATTGRPHHRWRNLLSAAPRAATARAHRRNGYPPDAQWRHFASRSEEHTSELQSRENLVCRLLLEKKKKTQTAKGDN